MNIRRKVAAAAVTGAALASSLALAAPAQATVTWVPDCSRADVHIALYSGNDYCYVFNGDYNNNVGWANAQASTICSEGPWGGIVQDTVGRQYAFSPYGGCQFLTNPVTVRWIEFLSHA
ncbi:hypothetical protein GCM10029978_048260 [Actinoallomurus acanthiterrae]